tara:strand:+ start:551 stop:1246 length:696 start_codon:yes stop_codon:yes gene_type:complete
MEELKFENTTEFKEKIYNIYTTVRGLIDNRYNIDTEFSEIDFREFSKENGRLDGFLGYLNSKKTAIDADNIFDTLINPNESNEERTLIKYIKHNLTAKNTKNLIDSLLKNYDFDNLVLIFFNEKSNEKKKVIRLQLETQFSSVNKNTRIFMADELLFDITKHILVPKHTKYTEDYDILKKKLMIKHLDKLPFIGFNDPVARFIGLKENDIVKIERNELSQNNVSYRICKCL